MFSRFSFLGEGEEILRIPMKSGRSPHSPLQPYFIWSPDMIQAGEGPGVRLKNSVAKNSKIGQHSLEYIIG
jgi:hypothetical protein